MKKEKYESAELEIISFQTADVIMTSIVDDDEDDEYNMPGM